MEIIIMAIIAGVIGLLNKQKKQQEPAEKPPTQKPTVSKPRNLKETFDRHAKELAEEYDKQRKTFENKSEEAPRQRQLKRDQGPPRNQPEPLAAAEISGESRKSHLKKKADPIKESDITINKELQPRDIVNGIIFSEVLGPPRSKRRHGNRI
ncbi:hypothetical protein [Jeotgalibacillus salarius]|uniref:Uncharacterized protein n=1 Tax=Jeotgalibacillus salarius TaxID=546023 RepID=A0A4Y8LGA3_9BACL|nr:hypothetical protein [Jeotgalibacillus salarius]TFE01110.1 hypothetical protein E2626_10645 [Jeotgalibacillus salarius]